MPRGGRRLGAGRPAKGAQNGVVIGLDGVRKLSPPPPADMPDAPVEAYDDLSQPPPGLSADLRPIWLSEAPHAIREGTLVQATVAGFKKLCEQWFFVEELAKDLCELMVIERQTKTASRDAAEKYRIYATLSGRLESSLDRFKLTAYGKPAVSAQPKTQPAANPWAQVAKK